MDDIRFYAVEYPEFFCHPGPDERKLKAYFSERGETICNGRIFKGVGASPEIVEGTILVLDSPYQAFGEESLSKCILVTKNTDPAWVFIMSQCKDLISEKGSLLSHTAIIGRELGVPAGRIVGTIDRLLGGELGFFGYFECIDNHEVSKELFRHCLNWLKNRGCKTVHGPVNSNIYNTYRLQISGFEKAVFGRTEGTAVLSGAIAKERL